MLLVRVSPICRSRIPGLHHASTLGPLCRVLEPCVRAGPQSPRRGRIPVCIFRLPQGSSLYLEEL